MYLTMENQELHQETNPIPNSEKSQKQKGIFRNFYLNFLRGLLGLTFSLLAAASIIYIVLVFVSPMVSEWSITLDSRRTALFSDKSDSLNVKKEIESLNTEIKRVENLLYAFTPKSPFIIVSTSDNRFYLYSNRKLVREGNCSTGSFILLENAEGKKWLFSTPKGIHKVQSKLTDPVWRRPDWAFVEEGLPIPSATDPSRYEYGVLGDYALSIGDGYLIHGTINKRQHGKPVTHGCVRLGDEDLEAVYKTLPVGAKVIIY